VWVLRGRESGSEEVGTEEGPGNVVFGGVRLDKGVVLAMFGVEGQAGGGEWLVNGSGLQVTGVIRKGSC
jgi:hypothetical protein